MSVYIDKAEIQEKLDNIVYRPWQQDSIDDQETVLVEKKIFVQETVTGGGKTFLGVCSAMTLIASGFIDRVIVMSPSTEIRDGWAEEFNNFGLNVSADTQETEDKFGYTVTYHAAIPLTLGTQRTLLIIDEFHHAEREAEWGKRVNSMAGACGYCLCLTATPWMTAGEIALMKHHGYYGADNIIKPDNYHRYEDDLKLSGNDRSTVPANFEFFDSMAYEKPKEGKEKKVIHFTAPSEDLNDWELLADINCQKQLTPHVHINTLDNELEDNKMAFRMMWRAVNCLEKARSKTKNRAIGLVVAKSQREAKILGEFIELYLEHSVQVITSDDTESAEKLKKIRKSKTKPDWVVSVGIVSEGVDIPEIKVIVYLSAITTELYLEQVIGRALRRINIGTIKEPRYLDKDVNDTEATILMPAHPKLLYVAWLFEDAKRQAAQAKKPDTDSTPDEPAEVKQYQNEGGEDSVGMYRGSSFSRVTARLIDVLSEDPDAKVICTGAYMAWVRSIPDAEQQLEELRDKCRRFGIDPDALTDLGGEDDLTYDQKTALAKTNSKRITSLIRFSHPSFKNLSDSSKPNPYAKVRSLIDKQSNVCWVKSTLEGKKAWLHAAQELYQDGKR